VTPEWSVEMYTDARGHCPIQDWFESLSAAKFAAMDAAIRYRLQTQGIGLAGTAWLKPLKGGLYEFRVRSTAAEITRMYATPAVFLRRTPRQSCSGSFYRSTATGSCCCSTAMTRPRTRARSDSSGRLLRLANCWWLGLRRWPATERLSVEGGDPSADVDGLPSLTVCVITHTLVLEVLT